MIRPLSYRDVFTLAIILALLAAAVAAFLKVMGDFESVL